jgi:hypothetical protein
MGELFLICLFGDGEVFLQFEVVFFEFIADVVDFGHSKRIFESAYFLKSKLSFPLRLFHVIVWMLLAMLVVELLPLFVFLQTVVTMISVHDSCSELLFIIFYFLGILRTIILLLCFLINWLTSHIFDINLFLLLILCFSFVFLCCGFLDCSLRLFFDLSP